MATHHEPSIELTEVKFSFNFFKLEDSMKKLLGESSLKFKTDFFEMTLTWDLDPSFVNYHELHRT